MFCDMAFCLSRELKKKEFARVSSFIVVNEEGPKNYPIIDGVIQNYDQHMEKYDDKELFTDEEAEREYLRQFKYCFWFSDIHKGYEFFKDVMYRGEMIKEMIPMGVVDIMEGYL